MTFSRRKRIVKKNRHEFENRKNEWYFNIFKNILQLLKEIKEHHDWHFSEIEGNRIKRISNYDYASNAI